MVEIKFVICIYISHRVEWIKFICVIKICEKRDNIQCVLYAKDMLHFQDTLQTLPLIVLTALQVAKCIP
jgi:UDP-N-acetylglucosamine 2-epimerase